MRGGGEEELFRLVCEILKRNDNNLFNEINGSKKESPLTISPFLKGAKSYQDYSFLLPHQNTSFRITYLREEFLEPVIKEFFSLSAREKSFKFSNGEILIERVDWQQGSKADFTSFEDIFSLAQDKRIVILEFCSPTSFQSKGEQKLFPLPELVFSSLHQKWRAFSNVKIPAAIEEEFGKIRVIQLRLKTKLVNFSDLLSFMWWPDENHLFYRRAEDHRQDHRPPQADL